MRKLQIPAGTRMTRIEFLGKLVGFVFEGIGYVGVQEANWPPEFRRDMGMD